MEHALLLGWTGELDLAYERMQTIARRCIERGEEGDLIFIYFQVALNRIWRGDFAAARRVAADADNVARHLGGEFPIMLSLVIRAWLAAYDGNEGNARTIIAAAIDASRRSGTGWHEDWSLTALGFLETSLGNHGAALHTLEPMLSRFAAAANTTEIFAAAFLPDAIEALIELGRVDDAEPLVGALEQNGQRRDRAWMRAVAARCRGMVAAARGDMETAISAVQYAMGEHDRLPMPFERARTQLLLGQLARRQRHKEAATIAVRDALTTFEELGTPLWAKRARAEQTRVDTTPATDGLTAAEHRVAELAASGMTNRDVAGALFISPKTVEATLARVYRKLGIRSRAELGRRMGKV